MGSDCIFLVSGHVALVEPGGLLFSFDQAYTTLTPNLEHVARISRGKSIPHFVMAAREVATVVLTKQDLNESRVWCHHISSDQAAVGNSTVREDRVVLAHRSTCGPHGDDKSK